MQGKTIVVTGASSGIGAAFARLAGAAGANQLLIARREPELHTVAADAGHHALALVADVTSREQVERAVAIALSRFGRIDVWINNAGRAITRPVSQLTDEDVDEMMVAAYYGAEDMGEAEQRPPFGFAAPRPKQ